MRHHALLLVLLCALCPAQTVLAQFDGEAGAGSIDHPNATAACYGGQCVEATEQGVSVYDYFGNLLKYTDISTFITNAGQTPGTIRDPRIAFDWKDKVWLLVCSCTQSFLIVSNNTPDATGTWRSGRLGNNTGDLTMHVCSDANGVYVTELTPNSTPASYTLFAIPHSEVTWTGNNSPTLTHTNPHTLQNYNLICALDRNPNKQPSDPTYFIARDGPLQNATNVSFNLLVSYCTWSGTTFCDPQTNSTTIPQPYLYNTPLNESQAGTSTLIKGLESHFFMAATIDYTNGKLWAALGTGPCTTGGTCSPVDAAHNIAAIYGVNVPALTLAQNFKLADASIGFTFPSLDLDSANNLFMIASGVSSTTNPSIYSFTHKATDGAGVVNGPTLVTAGTQPYTAGASPVGFSGNYTSTVQDGSASTKVWSLSTYANSATAYHWQTRLIEMVIPSAASTPAATSIGMFAENGLNPFLEETP